MTILNNILAVSVREFRVMCTRYSILMVLSGGIFLYGLLYNYMYAPNVVRNAPVAVVDMGQTPLSRHYSRLLDATPQAQVLTNNADLQQLDSNLLLYQLELDRLFESKPVYKNLCRHWLFRSTEVSQEMGNQFY